MSSLKICRKRFSVIISLIMLFLVIPIISFGQGWDWYADKQRQITQEYNNIIALAASITSNRNLPHNTELTELAGRSRTVRFIKYEISEAYRQESYVSTNEAKALSGLRALRYASRLNCLAALATAQTYASVGGASNNESAKSLYRDFLSDRDGSCSDYYGQAESELQRLKQERK